MDFIDCERAGLRVRERPRSSSLSAMAGSQGVARVGLKLVDFCMTIQNSRIHTWWRQAVQNIVHVDFVSLSSTV